MEETGRFSDEELLSSLKTGNNRNSAIRYLYSTCFDSLTAYTMQNSGSLQDAEDIFQEVLVDFIGLVRFDKFRGESNIKTFLFSINRFKWLNELKKRNAATARELKYEKNISGAEKNIGDLITQKESTAGILQLVEALGEKCKKILLLFYYENMAMKEILSHTDYENEQVLRNKKHKCLKEMERMISEKPFLKQALKSFLHG